MLKYVLIIAWAFSITNFSYSQSLYATDLVKLVNISFGEATQYLTVEKQFRLTSSQTVYGQTINQYNKHFQDVTEFVVKSQWQDDIVHPFVHYDVKPKSYASSIIKQLEQLQFKLKSKEVDSLKSVWLYETNEYMISIYTFTGNKLPASIEIHLKK